MEQDYIQRRHVSGTTTLMDHAQCAGKTRLCTALFLFLVWASKSNKITKSL